MSEGLTRITDKHWRNLDPWECCGQDNYCQRGCHDEGGCANGCIVPKIYCRLARYEEMDDAGLLIKLKCKVGDKVYILWSGYNANYDSVYPADVTSISIIRMFKKDSLGYSVEPIPGTIMVYFDDDFGKRWFLTREEAETALEDMNEKPPAIP